MIFNICLIIFLSISFLITFAGIGAVAQKLEFILESLKQIIGILKAQCELDETLKSGIEDIMNNTICIYQKLEEMDPDLSSNEVAKRGRKTNYN